MTMLGDKVVHFFFLGKAVKKIKELFFGGVTRIAKLFFKRFFIPAAAEEFVHAAVPGAGKFVGGEFSVGTEAQLIAEEFGQLQTESVQGINPALRADKPLGKITAGRCAL